MQQRADKHHEQHNMNQPSSNEQHIMNQPSSKWRAEVRQRRRSLPNIRYLCDSIPKAARVLSSYQYIRPAGPFTTCYQGEVPASH